ncbi:MAG: acetylxylan esterase [Paludibacteraceae bacterium]|nr:acetylxylan esterase [Paludibacteraceae bacterium]
MKRFFLIIFFAISIVSACMADVIYQDEYRLGSGWAEYQQLLVSNHPMLSKAVAGDVIAVTVSEVGSGAQLMLQTTSWIDMEGCFAQLTADGVYSFALTETTANEVANNGLIVKGINYTLNKVELLYDKTIWTGLVSDNSGWTQTEPLANSLFADLKEGSLLGVTIDKINNGADWHQYAFYANYRSNLLSNTTTEAQTIIHTLTAAQADSLLHRTITIAAQYLDVTALHTYTATRQSASAGETQTVWTGETVFADSWSVWEQLPASLFANAVEGQLLRLKYSHVGAGAQLRVSKGDWNDMPDAPIANISGVYQDFTVTAEMLTALKEGGMIVSGISFTLTSVQLINPADLRPLTLSVPVTNNWIYDGVPTIYINIENPYNETVTANIVINISTDKAQPVTSLQRTVEIAANTKQQVVITPEGLEEMAAGFYHITCLVNDDLARAFIVGVRPTDIVSAPDKQSDFDTYWRSAKEQLSSIEMNATLTEITSKSTSARKVYLVEFNSVPDGLTGEPVVVRGYYCEPQDGKRHPVIMHYAGYDSGYRPGGQDVKPYCPSGDAEPQYAEFFLSTRGQNINNRAANEREADGKGDFTNTYGDWFAFHFGDKESYYYRGAFMDCVQAVRFMATRESSDMSNLFAEGQSQGGAFTYAAAALSDYPFTAIAPAIAFLGDYPDYFDIANWPAYVAKERQGTMTDEEMFAFLSYFDTKNLATGIKTPTIACIGLQDNVCPPHTNIAPYNNLLSEDKELIFNPELMHQAAGGWYNDYMAFFAKHLTDTPSALTTATETRTTDKKIYNVLGQRVDNPTNGIYIIGGQKVVVR